MRANGKADLIVFQRKQSGWCINLYQKKNQNKPPKDMAKELEKYKDRVFYLTKTGQLRKIWLNSLADYDHSKCHLHHFIEYQHYAGNEEWYKQHGIEQKLILVSIPLHEQLHSTAIKTLSDDEFYKYYGVNRSELIFSKKHSNY